MLRGSSKIHVTVLSVLLDLLQFSSHSCSLWEKVNVPVYGPSDGDMELEVFFIKHSSEERSVMFDPKYFLAPY